LSVGPTNRRFSPCPTCGKRGRRKRVEERTVGHIAHGHKAFILARVGVYRARCGCCKFFRAPIPGVLKGTRYSLEVRNLTANSLIRDRLPYRKVLDRMREDFELDLSVGFVHNCFLWAREQIDTEEHWRFVVANFSGVVCIDEVHDGGKAVLYATDPLNDFTIHFEIVDKNDQEHMDAFLTRLKERGICPQVAITDGSPLYKDALQEIWQGIEHQLCIFHVVKDVNKVVLDAVRSIKNKIKRRGKGGRKRRRGPRTKQQQAYHRRRGRTRKEEAAFIWEHQHLIVKRYTGMTAEEKGGLLELYRIAPKLKVIRRFSHDFYRLFERGITKQQTRNRRTRMLNNPAYQDNAFLQKALKKIRPELFEKMIVFMEWKDMERTSNHVERNNRAFRMLQKTRYRRRRKENIIRAIELDLHARMLKHPLYDPGEARSSPDVNRPVARKSAA
jgi:transposase-like protein